MRSLKAGSLRTYLLYGAAVVIAVAIVPLALMPSVSVVIGDWSRRDVELRSKLLFNSIRDQVALYLADGSDDALTNFFERLTDDEKLLGLAYCSDRAQLRAATKLMPASFTCEKLARGETASFSTTESGGRSILVAAFPLAVKDTSGHVAILHDLSFIESRASEARWYWLTAVSTIAMAFGAAATLLVLNLVRRWRRAVRQTIREARSGWGGEISREAASVLGPELRSLLRDLGQGTHASAAIQVNWSPQVLHKLLEQELPDVEVLVVSNREPYIHNYSGDQIAMQIPASGLVAALEPVMRATSGTWIAHGSGTADRATVDNHDRIAVPPGSPAYTLRRVWLSEEEQKGYYYGFANEGVWPLCHISFVRPNFREQDWRVYHAVNARFADVVVEEARDDNPVVLIQDYHFAMLPKLLRKRLPRATILTFWHIPWPNAETFSICPWKEQIIEGMLGSDVLGFHTQFHCNNFLETVDRFVESRIDRERAAISLAGRETAVRSYPISIAWPLTGLAEQKTIADCRQAVRARFQLDEDVKIAVGVERFDYTKGVLDRLHAVNQLLTRYPEWKGRFVLLQAAAPTRSQLGIYQELQAEATAVAAKINARHGTRDFEPIRLVVRHHEPHEVLELFRATDVCVVSSLHDGMNLVAKEFVAARDDEAGVLVLSHFAGASRELTEALIVNPYDAHGLSEVLHQALLMPEKEQQMRMRLMRALVRERNVYRWAGQMLLDAAQLRRRQQVFNFVEKRRA